MNEMNYENLVFYDLETSGLDLKKHEIIQIGAIDAKTKDEFEVKIDFDVNNADPEALKVVRFDENKWDQEGVSLQEGLEKFNDFLSRHATLERESKKTGKAYKIAILAGFNNCGFDNIFLFDRFKRNHIFLHADYRSYDIFSQVLWKYPNLTDYKLKTLCQRFGVKLDEEHDALSDAKATMRLAKKIMEDDFSFKKVAW